VPGPADSFADQLVEVVGLGDGEVAHGEVVDHDHGRFGETFDAGGEAVVGVAAGELGEQTAGGDEVGVEATPAGLVGERDGEVGFADSDGPVDAQPFAGGDELESGEVADVGGWQFRVEGEVEAFQGCCAGQVRGLLSLGGLLDDAEEIQNSPLYVRRYSTTTLVPSRAAARTS
jgi:hypothetical protein